MNFYYEHILFIPFIAFILSIFIKGFFSFIKKWKLDLSIALWSWGMPSAHTAVTVSLTTSLAIKHWITTDIFALALSFTLIIIVITCCGLHQKYCSITTDIFSLIQNWKFSDGHSYRVLLSEHVMPISNFAHTSHDYQ